MSPSARFPPLRSIFSRTHRLLYQLPHILFHLQLSSYFNKHISFTQPSITTISKFIFFLLFSSSFSLLCFPFLSLFLSPSFLFPCSLVHSAQLYLSLSHVLSSLSLSRVSLHPTAAGWRGAAVAVDGNCRGVWRLGYTIYVMSVPN